MARETTKWPSTRWPITKIMPSDGCNGNRVPLEMGPWYDFREFGCHLGNVGFKHFAHARERRPEALYPERDAIEVDGIQAFPRNGWLDSLATVYDVDPKIRTRWFFTYAD